MKKQSNLIIAIGFIISFIAGVIVGLALANPGISIWESVGTIGKVDKYRNVKVTEDDVELRNKLADNESLREAYQRYLIYEYTANVKMADDIRFAIEEASKAPGFMNAYSETIGNLEQYAIFLDNTRLHLLEAVGSIDDLDRKGQIAVKHIMNKAGNALAQNQYRTNLVFKFLNDVEEYFQTTGKDNHPQLAKAHDLLYANLFFSSIINNDHPGLKYLSARELFSENENLAMSGETLMDAYLLDMDLLGSLKEANQLLVLLNGGGLRLKLEQTLSDAEKVNVFFNAEQLSSFRDKVMDAERLGFWDAEQLNLTGLYDSEYLWVFSSQMIITDAEKLNDVFLGREQLMQLSVP